MPTGHVSAARSALGLNRRVDSLGCRRKGAVKGVAHGLEHCTAVGLKGCAQDRIVAAQGSFHRLGLGLPQARAAFDVGEEKRNRSGW